MSGPARTVTLALALVAAAACHRVPRASAGIPGRASAVPRSGLEVIGAMRFAHPSRELRSLAFRSTVRTFGSDTSEFAERAQLLLPGRFRFAREPESRGSGRVRDGMSEAVFAAGRRQRRERWVELSTLLAFDVYAQGIDSTIRWLDSSNVRFGLHRLDEWNGRKVWVVGAEAGDTLSDQFWVDADRWHVVRVIQRLPTGAREDIRFDAWTTVRDVPVPRRIVTWRDGRVAMRRDLGNFIPNLAVPERVFDLARWRVPD